jgi:type II secretion system protein D
MKIIFTISPFPIALALVLTLGATNPVSAQVRPQTQQTRSTGVGQVGGGGVSYGGGSSANGTRQYLNSTQVGDAMITSDLETRRLIVVTDDETNANIRTIIADLDKPKPQVLINVVFLQVEHDKDLNLGTQLTLTGGLAGSTNSVAATTTTNFGVPAPSVTDPSTYGGFYSILGKDVNATIRALSTTNKTEILSRPSILTRSNQQATIMVGQSIPIVTNSQVSSITNAITNTVTYQDIGIILKVTPFITENGMVEMIVSPQISSISATTVPISTGVNSPVIDKRSADTVVVTPSDRTVVIGGLISNNKTDSEDKVPLLGDIPVLGNLFKHKVTGSTRTELLIFLTPHVVQNPGDLSHVADAERAKFDLIPKTFPKESNEK